MLQAKVETEPERLHEEQAESKESGSELNVVRLEQRSRRQSGNKEQAEGRW